MSTPTHCPHCGAAASDSIRDFDHYTCWTHIATACRPYDPCRDRELATLRQQIASLNESWVQEGLRAAEWRRKHDALQKRLAALHACAEQLAKALMAIEWRGSKPTPGGYQQYCCPACKGDLISKQHGESCDIARALAAFAKLKGGAL